MTNPTPNDDEGIDGFIGNFHKTLPHNEYGEVDQAAYYHFRDLCGAIESGVRMDFEGVPRGGVHVSGLFKSNADTTTAKFTSPLAGAASETFGPEPRSLEMPPAPGIRSLSTAAEMVELYWMAVLRDKPMKIFHGSGQDNDVDAARTELGSLFQKVIENDRTAGALQLGRDLPQNNAGKLDLRLQTLFRCGLKDEEFGPLVSQFFLRNIPFGTQTIDTRQVPYATGKDYLTTFDYWLLAQNTGKDRYGRDYANCNYYNDDNGYYEHTQSAKGTQIPAKRHISTLRDLARFVNRDALHQAYFNAALFLDAFGAELDAGNPYRTRYKRTGGFATLGGPDLLTLVSEVASRALKVVWRQKWLVHRRARPEVYGGLIEMQLVGRDGKTRDYGLPQEVLNSKALALIKEKYQTHFLPMAYSAGSPPHPAYGAGHATVAGACVTILKAWFDEDKSFKELLDRGNAVETHKEPTIDVKHTLLQPGGEIEYAEADTEPKMTIGGELNKLASNVAMGRSMGGVHWRSDNTRSLRLGEQIAIEILRKRVAEYAEKAVSFTFISFDRKTVHITPDGVSVK